MVWIKGMKAVVMIKGYATSQPVPIEVKIMAVSDGYAMVRHRDWLPIVRQVSELLEVENVQGSE